MTTLYENNSSGSPTPLYANNTNWYAQTFTPQVTHGIKTVRIHAAYAHLTTPGICTVSIKAVDVDGKPTGDDLCSGTRNANLFNHSWSGTQWEEFDLGDGYPLLAGTTYAIVIRSQAPHVYCLYGYQNSTYTRGKYASSTDSGSNWTLNNTYDIWFEEYGELIAEPDVYTLPVTDIEDTAAVGNGNIEEPDGTSYITERGICYCLASHGTPDINDSKVTSEGTAGEYSIPITGLDPSADYHARAYAVANLGTYYGETVDFTTQVEMEVVQILTMADVVDEDDMASDSEVMVPTQQSVKELRSIGIQPDILLCRSEKVLSPEIKAKIALFCNVGTEMVITAQDVENIYTIPQLFHQEGLDERLIETLNIWTGAPRLEAWQNLQATLRTPQGRVEIGIIGKYVDLTESYKSLHEDLVHAGVANEARCGSVM